MGLFSTLASSASEVEKTRTSTLDIPNVIQLYSTSPIIVEKNANSRKFSVLSYQTVHVASSAAYEGGALLSKQEQEATSLHPNLGVWNCRVTKSTNSSSGDEKPIVDDIFRNIPTSNGPPTICMSVDLSNLTEVEPTISLMQAALVRYLIDRGQMNNSVSTFDSATATTSLYDLRSTNFGLAVNDEESSKKMSTAAPEADDKKIRISLTIAVMLPSRGSQGENSAAESSVSSGGYKEKQAEALVLYHLRKYAASLNAVLCFVRKDKPSEEESQAIEALTLNQLSFVWQQLARGQDGWKELGSADGESDQAAVSGIYGPGSHQEDLIESVLLRNAQFPGQWDASKDSLWAALPASQTDDEENATASNTETGDEAWLNELRSSVASEAKTPPPSASKGDTADTAKTPNDAAVSSFFESLLKP